MPGWDGIKVPSAVAYEDSKLIAWGFGTRELEGVTPVIRAFKGMIDRGDIAHFRGQNRSIQDRTRTHAMIWLRDYLEHLREYLESELRNDLPQGSSWNSSRIVYLFSYPTTWSEKTIENFRTAIRDAGFGAQPSHVVKVNLNEAEAAIACYFTSGSLPTRGDHLMIADIGGGTCDVGIYSIDYPKDAAYPRLVPRTRGMGVNIGSSKIDEHFEINVAERLKPIVQEATRKTKDIKDTDVDALVAGAIRDVSMEPNYVAAKHDFGNPRQKLAKLTFFVPKASLRVTNESILEKCERTMWFDKEPILKPAFDQQCKEIWDLIQRYINNFLETPPSEGTIGQETKSSQKDVNKNFLSGQTFHLVLSGGMSQSVYVQNHLRDALSKTPHVGTRSRVTLAESPQLVVCKGLVLTELKTLKSESVWTWRANHSYGIIQSGAAGNKPELAISKNDEINHAQRKTAPQIPLEMDTDGSFELYLAEFQQHIPKKRWSMDLRSPQFGSPRIIGAIAEGTGQTIQSQKVSCSVVADRHISRL